MPNTKSMGDVFEQLTKLYFLIDPLYRSMYQDVWLLDEVPQKDLKYLELPRQDLGIDLIAKSGSEYHAIQCKYHSNKNTSVNNREVATFTSLLANKKNLSHGYICSTAINTSGNFNKLEIENVSNVLYDRWSTLNKDFFDNARKILDNKKPKEKPYIPKPHQEKAIKLAHKHFIKENNSRGKLIFPCGSGKSLTGFWMMEKLNANSTLVAVPSLSLVKQTLEVYLKQVVANNKNVKWLCICSDEGIGKSDDIVTYTRDLPVPCTTDPEYIKQWLKTNKNENIIIFTTYQSGRLIAEVSKSLKFTFDLGVYDEAHKTVGKNESLFSYLLFEENISVKHRIFMTATERFYRGVRDDVLTMDNPDDYGDVFCHMSFKEAIEKDLLTDYKVITIEVKKEEIATFIKDNNLVKSNAKWGKENEARSLASMIALRKAMKRFPIRNAVSFHSSIERATRNKDVQKHITDTYNYKPIDTFHVSGRLPTTKRNAVVQEFAKSDRGLITNSRCLTEGVDVPNIDCIVFADPRKSKVDIVQALGRALRKKPGKDWGYVVLPVIYDHTSHEIDNENFQEILNIVRGLAANDERIIEEFKDKSQNSGRVTGAREEIFRIDPELLNESELVDNLSIKLWEKLSRFNWMPFEEAKEFAHSLGLNNVNDWRLFQVSESKPKNIPSNPNNVYKESWKSWGDWLGTFRIANQKKTYKNFESARKYVRGLNLKYDKEWREFRKSGNRPPDIPSNPNIVYKDSGWISLADFIGGDRIAERGVFKSFEVARDFVRKLNLKGQKEWREFRKSGNRPPDIPSNPNIVYKDSGWISLADFIGTKPGWNNKWMSFEKAREYIRSLNLKSQIDYQKFIKSNPTPNDFPRKVERVYKNNGWLSWGDFLGYSKGWNGKYREFKEARKFVRSLSIKSHSEWKKFCDSGKKPIDIPFSGYITYKNKGWINAADYFGHNRTPPQFRKYKSYKNAKAFVKKLNLKTQKEWKEYAVSGKKPDDIPSNPSNTYKKKGKWKGYGDWLGTDYISAKTKSKARWSFEKARKHVRRMNFKSLVEYRSYVLSEDGPLGLPVNLHRAYKGKGWKGSDDFLGKKD